jgi:uncharacterized protein (UPF0335 family)
VANPEQNVQPDIREFDTLSGSIGALDQSNSLRNFQERIDRLEEDIEKMY